MSEVYAMALLENRVESLEALVAGRSAMGVEPIPSRIEALAARVEELYTGMPELKEGVDLCLDLEGKLYNKRASIMKTGENIQYILSARDDLLKSFKLLDSVQSLESAARGCTFQGIL